MEREVRILSRWVGHTTYQIVPLLTLGITVTITSWAGSRVTRFAPDGSIDVIISIPSAWNVTACCFGGAPPSYFLRPSRLDTPIEILAGPNLDQLYITTASALAVGGDLSAQLDHAAVQVQHPDSGDLFMVALKGKFRDGGWRHEFAG